MSEFTTIEFGSPQFDKLPLSVIDFAVVNVPLSFAPDTLTALEARVPRDIDPSLVNTLDSAVVTARLNNQHDKNTRLRRATHMAFRFLASIVEDEPTVQGIYDIYSASNRLMLRGVYNYRLGEKRSGGKLVPAINRVPPAKLSLLPNAFDVRSGEGDSTIRAALNPRAAAAKRSLSGYSI